MTNTNIDAEKLSNLLSYAQSDGRICPQPMEWDALYKLLPDKVRKGSAWEPPPPLILGAWWYTGSLEKHLRFKEHIEYAAQKGVLDMVDSFIRSLTNEQWYTRDKD